MSDQYMKEILRVAVAQICQTIGYNATQTAPLELLQDVLDKFLKEFTRDLRRQVEHYNRTEPNLNDVTLTLSSINVNLNELLDYINNVEPVPFALEVPKFPARKDSALNFLKPGSKEVLTRPVHVHDHLPPMLPPDITQPPEAPLGINSNSLTDSKTFPDNIANISNSELTNDTTNKSGAATLNKTTLQSLFKPSNYEDGERPTREVSSVVMTTGGYISPAVEGKMPEAMVPDIIDKLLGLDAPPPPTPPPPPPPPPAPVARPPSRAGLIPTTVEDTKSTMEKDLAERERDAAVSTIKETKKSLARSLEPQPISNKKLELLQGFQNKKNKLFNPTSGKGYQHDSHHMQSVGGGYNKKSFMMHQNAANMLLKKAKKQKVPLNPGQSGLNEKQNKPPNDKIGKMDAADKAHKKYMKMLQKMAKQGKIPPEILSNIMGPDKKSKIINPAIVASMPPGPEKLQLEKLLRKQAKQRQKMIKQQMMLEVQKQSKKPVQQPPPLVPIFPPKTNESLNKPLTLEFEEHKLKMEHRDPTNISPVKSSFAANVLTPGPSLANHLTPDMSLTKVLKPPSLNENQPVDIMEVTSKPLNTQDAKELKLSNEPDRSKLNIFKKISKQKIPKSASPTPLRVPGLSDTPIINLPSGTTITPSLGPINPPNSIASLNATPLGRHLFPPLPDNNMGGGALTTGLMKTDGLNKPVAPAINTNQPTDLSMLNRVFGEKPPEVELVNKPKKRGRKPGSKNSPKIPGVFPNNLLKKNSKKLKMDNSNIFNPQMPPQLPPEFAAAASMGNLSFENVAQLFGNPLNPMEWAQNKHLQQQMMIMATAKERKEHKKKTKMPKQDNLNIDKTIPNLPNMTPISHNMAGPTNEEVQSINKKLMRMDTILKTAPLSAVPSALTIDTSLITGKRLAASPSMFPSSSTSPLKSPGNTKRMLTASADAMASSLVPPFMLPNRPAFPNLPTNMLSMLQFPFPPRPGLIPTPGLFPTPGLGAFPTNPKNPLLPGLFPFPNLKHTMADNSAINQESEDLTTDKKKLETNLQTAERSYCNVAPLVPDFLTKLSEQNANTINSSNKHVNDPPHAYEPELTKTSKPRNSHSATLLQDNFMKKIVDVHKPENVTGNSSNKTMTSTPAGMSLNTFEQLMKKCDSPIDLMTFNKHAKHLPVSQESGLDFSMNKKANLNTNVTGAAAAALTIKTPITLNNEPIEVSDDSDENNQPQPPAPLEKRPMHHAPSSLTSHLSSQQPQQLSHNNNFIMDEIFVPNNAINFQQKCAESDLSVKEVKKTKKQIKKSSSVINTNLIKTDKTDGLTSTTTPNSGGVGKLAGGADLIPLISTGLAYSAKNIPYNSLTANANPSFHSHKTDFSNTTTITAASTSATAASSSVFDNLTITAAIPPSSGSANPVFDLQKKRKEHKKLKKLKEFKEGKIKKKKDKKDKNKSKEKAEKYLLNQAQISPSKEKEKEQQADIKDTPLAVNTAPVLTAPSSGSSAVEKVKDKDLIKKLKREKKKEKQRTILEDNQTPTSATVNQPSMVSSNVTSHKEKSALSTTTANINILEGEAHRKQKLSPGANYNTATANERNDSALTINATTSLQTPVSIVPKLTLKLGSTHSPTPPRDDSHKTLSNSSSATLTAPATGSSAAVQPPQAVTSPPREREPSPELARISPLVTRPPKHKLNTSGDLTNNSSNTSNSISAANASSLEIGENIKNSSASNSNMIVPPPSPWLSGGTISASSVLLPIQLLQTTKQHEITSTPMGNTHNTDVNTKNANADRQSPLTLITETSRPSSYIDAEGNRVWICPACGKVDDGSPMIGCDGCDAWYHWVCVGIFVAPKDNEDWFCRVCITRKKGLHASDKKRKRNKKK